jgi:Carbohydrate family 9 binding domain-like
MKSYLCKKINENIRIDGILAKPIWDVANEIELMETQYGGKPCQETVVKALWNEDYLYIGFRCNDDEISATMEGYNEPLYLEEVVEVFIDDNRDLKTYTELEVNPLNALLYYLIFNDIQGKFIQFARVNKTVETAVLRIEGSNVWSVEMALPFSEFVTAKNIPPVIGDSWLVNFYRIDRRKNGPDEYSAWSQTDELNFHKPEKFGELVFTE